MRAQDGPAPGRAGPGWQPDDPLSEVLCAPVSEALPRLRAAGLLPSAVTRVPWTPDPARIEPSVAALAQLDPRRPYTGGKAALSACRVQRYRTAGDSPEVVVDATDGAGQGVLYFRFSALGPGRACTAWFDLLVSGPPDAVVALGGTGSPVQLVVDAGTTAGRRVSVPLDLTALPSGTALAYLVPVPTGAGTWFGTTVYDR